MNPQETTQQADAIETIFAIPFSKLKLHEMSKEDMMFFAELYLIGNKPLNIPEKEKPFLMQVMDKRIDACFTYKMDDTVILFIANQSQVVGTAIMYLWYFQYLSKKHGIDRFTMEHFGNFFGDGFPKNEDLHKLWLNQKIIRDTNNFGSDNLLDYASAGQSILN
jgi:hypothetical protein